MVENVGVAAEIASPSHSVQKLFLLPVCVVAILRFPCRPTSDHVVSGISESGMAENVGAAAEIASPSLSVQKLFLLLVSISGFVADFSVTDVDRCRTMSAVSYSGRAWSKMWG